VSEGMREEVISSGGTVDPTPAARYSSLLSHFLPSLFFLPKLGFCFSWTFVSVVFNLLGFTIFMPFELQLHSKTK